MFQLWKRYDQEETLVYVDQVVPSLDARHIYQRHSGCTMKEKTHLDELLDRFTVHRSNGEHTCFVMTVLGLSVSSAGHALEYESDIEDENYRCAFYESMYDADVWLLVQGSCCLQVEATT